MVVRYYIDADTLGLAKILAALRIDVTYPGDPGETIKRHKRPVCPVTSTAVPDDQWIPIVARAGWSIITRDQRIRNRPAEIAAVTAYREKVFASPVTSDSTTGTNSKSSCASGAESNSSVNRTGRSSTASREQPSLHSLNRRRAEEMIQQR